MCVRCRNWLSRKPAYVPLHFIPLQSPDLPRRFPGIEALRPNEQLLVISDNGAVYCGASAWIMCLWALEKYQTSAQRLADPMLLPFARVACELLSCHRFFISRALFNEEKRAVVQYLAAHVARPPQQCSTTHASV